MTIASMIKKVTDLTKTTEEKQKEVSVSEVWHLNGHLQMRYNVLETTNILKNFAKSPDLQMILDHGVKVLQSQVNTLEELIAEYKIPLPQRPPFDASTIANVELITDRYVFRRIFKGIQTFIPTHANAFTQSTNPKIREYFKKFLFVEIDLYDKLVEYGKLKGFEEVPPRYSS